MPSESEAGPDDDSQAVPDGTGPDFVPAESYVGLDTVKERESVQEWEKEESEHIDVMEDIKALGVAEVDEIYTPTQRS